MHISEGVLSTPVLAGGVAAAAAGLAIGLKGLKAEEIPRVAVLSSAFFIGSLMRIPAGPVSGHLVLNGITGLLLGWAAFPSILVGLTLQALLFQFGGITVLGVNTLIIALPAVAVFYLFGGLVRGDSERLAWLGGFGAGALSVGLGAILIAAALTLSGEAFREAAAVTAAAHLPLAVIEGLFTGFCVTFLRKVRPEMIIRQGEAR